MESRKYDIEEKLIAFSSRIIDVVEALLNTRASNYIAAQLIRCELAPSLMYGEAQAAESRDDFIHKMKISCKRIKRNKGLSEIVFYKRND